MTDWQCFGASVEGRRHQEEGVPCEDALSFVQEQDWVLLAVADGAGSAPHGGRGAQLLVDACAYQAKLMFDSGIPEHPAELRTALYRLLARARRDVEAAARQQDLPLSDLASTVSVVLAAGCLMGAIQVGDGAIVLQRGSDALEQIAQTPQPEFVNQTTFLTSTDWRGATACHIEEHFDVRNLAVITDGLVPIATERPDGSPHAPFFDPLFDYAASPGATEEELESFLASDRVRAATGDDVTVLLAARKLA